MHLAASLEYVQLVRMAVVAKTDVEVLVPVCEPPVNLLLVPGKCCAIRLVALAELLKEVHLLLKNFFLDLDLLFEHFFLSLALKIELFNFVGQNGDALFLLHLFRNGLE